MSSETKYIRGIEMGKRRFIRTVILYLLYSIMMIILGIRIAMTHVLEGALLVLYLVLVFFAVYVIIGHGIRIHREYKNNQN